MNFSYYIAKRYIFSKKKSNAVNIISAISVMGVALATMAMVCVLSGLNGFRDLIGDLFTAFDPELEVTARQGKNFSDSDAFIKKVEQHPQVESVAKTLEDHALILFLGRPTVVTLKGVDEHFAAVTGIGNILYGEGTYPFGDSGTDKAVPGFGLSEQLGGPDFGSLQICVPRKGERINLANPSENVNADFLQASGLCFQVHQQRYDESYILCGLQFAQQLMEQDGRVGALELRLRQGADVEKVKEELRELGEGRFSVSDRYEQQEDVFNVMKIEKAFAFFFLAFIVLIATFNIIGSVSMLIIDKREDVQTLRNLGASDSQIVRTFLFEGWLITAIGALLGIVLGLVLCLLQQHFGLLRLGNGDGNFIVDAYPISVHALDIVLIGVTVMIVGALSVAYPVRYLSRRLTS
ncbi:MAG: ABC transporter permease [Alloprevotella sp.]|nr:ABC transporter permease [Alloprevotella sp.]